MIKKFIDFLNEREDDGIYSKYVTKGLEKILKAENIKYDKIVFRAKDEKATFKIFGWVDQGEGLDGLDQILYHKAHLPIAMGKNVKEKDGNISFKLHGLPDPDNYSLLHI